VGFSITTLVSLAVTRHIKARLWRMVMVLLICPFAGAVVGGLIGPSRDVGVMAAVALVQSLAIVFFIEVLSVRGVTRAGTGRRARLVS
jgi:hypothetical protein